MLHRSSLPALAMLLGSSALACGSNETSQGTAPPPAAPAPPTPCTASSECAAEKETCDVVKSECVAISTATELGSGDGSPASVNFTEVHAVDAAAEIVDLAFAEKDPSQLWVIGYGDDSVHVGTGVTVDSKGKWKEYLDPAAMHFMHKPPAIAMGSNGFWGICGDNDNAQNDPRREPNYFMGPALFTSDLSVFAEPTGGGLGSHYDMLHNTSFCRGIAHVEANVFWVFNGQLGALEQYNFNTPHEPGGDDHKDGEIYRYVEGQVKGVEGVPSHVFYDPSDKFLYVADTGNGRIVRLDTTKGTLGERLPRRNEILKKSGKMSGVDVEEVVPPGTLTEPSGLEVRQGLIYVTDAATGIFHSFDKTGKEVRKLETGLPPRSLAGFTFGSEGKIWFVNRKGGKVVRIDPIVVE